MYKLPIRNKKGSIPIGAGSGLPYEHFLSPFFLDYHNGKEGEETIILCCST
jgi:hypothetical protein